MFRAELPDTPMQQIGPFSAVRDGATVIATAIASRTKPLQSEPSRSSPGASDASLSARSPHERATARRTVVLRARSPRAVRGSTRGDLRRCRALDCRLSAQPVGVAREGLRGDAGL